MIVSLEERTLDQGPRTKDHGPWTKEQGPSTVLYSTVQYCTVLDLGPCFGMNGHFRRDPDMMSRPPVSTIDFLSVNIGYGSLSKVGSTWSFLMKLLLLSNLCLSNLFRISIFFSGHYLGAF